MYEYIKNETTAAIRSEMETLRTSFAKVLVSPFPANGSALIHRANELARIEGALRVTEMVDVMRNDDDSDMLIIARLAEIASAGRDDDMVRVGCMAQASSMIAQMAKSLA